MLVKLYKALLYEKNFRFLSLVETIPVVALIKGPFGDVGLLVGCEVLDEKRLKTRAVKWNSNMFVLFVCCLFLNSFTPESKQN